MCGFLQFDRPPKWCEYRIWGDELGYHDPGVVYFPLTHPLNTRFWSISIFFLFYPPAPEFIFALPQGNCVYPSPLWRYSSLLTGDRLLISQIWERTHCTFKWGNRTSDEKETSYDTSWAKSQILNKRHNFKSF